MRFFKDIANLVLFGGGSILGAITKRSYKSISKQCDKYSSKKLASIVRAGRNTEFGSAHGLSSVSSSDDYRRIMPLTTYEDYEPYVKRMTENGEKHLLTRKKTVYFAYTSGTVSQMKYIPQAPASYIPYFKCILIYLNDLKKALKKRGVSSLCAHGLLLTETDILHLSERVKKSRSRIKSGVVSAYAAGGMRYFLPIFTPLPPQLYTGDHSGDDMQYIKARFALQDPGLKYIGGVFMSAVSDILDYMVRNRAILVNDMRNGTVSPEVMISDRMKNVIIKKLKADPGRASEVGKILDEAAVSDIPFASRLWNKLSYVGAIGTGDFEPFTSRVRKACDSSVSFGYAMYASTEALMGCAMRLEDSRYLLLPDTGFYEFIPVEEDGASCADGPVTTYLPHELKTGSLYEVVLTNLSGLYRYQLRDVIRVSGFEGKIPYIEFAYRANYITDMCGIHLTSEELASVIRKIEDVHDITIKDHCVYPDTESRPPHLKVFMETERDIKDGELEELEKTFNDTLLDVNSTYGLYLIKLRNIGKARLLPVRNGTFMDYRSDRISKGASMNQLKALRLIDTKEKLDFFNSAIISYDKDNNVENGDM